MLGVGNPLGGDDAAGVLLCRLLQKRGTVGSHVQVLEGGLAPENQTGAIRTFAPETVLMVDAALLGRAAGALMWVDASDIDGLGISSHSLPLSLLAHYLGEMGCAVHIIGIQPAHTDFGAPPSTAVLQSVRCLAGWLESIIPHLLPHTPSKSLRDNGVTMENMTALLELESPDITPL